MKIQALPSTLIQRSRPAAPAAASVPAEPADRVGTGPPDRSQRINHFVAQGKVQATSYLRDLSAAYAGELVGMTVGSIIMAPIALKAGNLYLLTGGAALAGGLGAIGSYMLSQKTARKAAEEANTKPGKLGGADLALAGGLALKSLPKFIYPTIVGATAAEQEIIYRGLDSLPLSGVTSAATIDVGRGLQAVGASGLATPLFSQSRIFLDRDEMMYPGWGEKVTVHEIGHTFDFTQGFGPIGSRSQWSGGFGKTPFVSDYAHTNRMEDYAESYLEYHTNPEGLRQVAPDKFRAIDASQQQGVVDVAMDRPEVRNAGKSVAQAIGAVPYARNVLELAGSLLAPAALFRGATQLSEGLRQDDEVKKFEGKLNLASGALLFVPGGAPLALLASGSQFVLGSQVASGSLTIEEANQKADTILALATGPFGMVGRAAQSEMAKAGVDLDDDRYQFDLKAVPASPVGAVLSTVGGLALGSLAGSCIGTALGGPVGAAAGMFWGRLAGAGVGLGGYGLYAAWKNRGSAAEADPLALTKGDKAFLAKVVGGAAAGGVVGSVAGGWGGAAVGRVIGTALAGAAGGVTGATLGTAVGVLGGSYVLAKAGAALGRQFDHGEAA